MSLQRAEQIVAWTTPWLKPTYRLTMTGQAADKAVRRKAIPARPPSVRRKRR